MVPVKYMTDIYVFIPRYETTHIHTETITSSVAASAVSVSSDLICRACSAWLTSALRRPSYTS